MTLSVGDSLPNVTVFRIGENGPEKVETGPLLAGKKAIIFGFPGAYTGTCTTAHVPSFIRTKAGFDAKGVDLVIGMAVNDPFVMKAFADSTGAAAAGLTMLGDAASAFTTAIGMNYDNANLGFSARAKRYAMYVEDGVIQVLHEEAHPGLCDLSAGESMLESI